MSKTTLVLENVTIDIEDYGAETKLIFMGELDEKFNYKKIALPNSKIFILNLGEITSINSCGIREWVYFMRLFSSTQKVCIEEASVSMVDQFNTVPQSLGNASVLSFYAPYYCPTCNKEVNYLIDAEQEKETLMQKKAPQVKHSCDTILDFDALEDCYFHQIEKFYNKRVG